MEWWQLAMLAVVQGLAELLPVSSSAHVILAQRFMGLDPGAPSMTFLLVMLHTGTMIAVITYFWPRWRVWLRASGPAHRGTVLRPNFQVLLMMAVATFCTGLVGFALKVVIERGFLEGLFGPVHGEVEHLFRSLALIASGLLAGGLLILIASVLADGPGHGHLTARPAILIGVVQGLCLPFRGFSRSGATISIALLCGLSRDLAEDFSFALAVWLTPPVVVLELRRLLHSAPGSRLGWSGVMPLLMPGAFGMALSAIAGWLALRWLSAWLAGGRWRYFGYYCCGFSVVVWVAYWAGW
jgi:undecaprenyl-diphosphatase